MIIQITNVSSVALPLKQKSFTHKVDISFVKNNEYFVVNYISFTLTL